MIYAASLNESKETEEERTRVYNLKEQLKHFAARPRQKKQAIVKRREKPVRPQVSAPRRERGKGRKCIKYPKSWYPNTPVCTKSKGGKRKYNVGTGRRSEEKQESQALDKLREGGDKRNCKEDIQRVATATRGYSGDSIRAKFHAIKWPNL